MKFEVEIFRFALNMFKKESKGHLNFERTPSSQASKSYKSRQKRKRERERERERERKGGSRQKRNQGQFDFLRQIFWQTRKKIKKIKKKKN